MNCCFSSGKIANLHCQNKFFRMKQIFTSAVFFFCFLFSFSQQNLPVGFAPGEGPDSSILGETNSVYTAGGGYKTPPPYVNLRTAAEWEEIQALTICWVSYTSILREIVRNAVNDAQVIIVCSDSTTVKNYLIAGSVPLTNVRYVIAPFNSIWIRDYGQNTVYGNNVDDLLMVDWHYNRPRPKDDTVPSRLSSYTGIPLYETSVAPYDLIHTGGNFMTDGFGTAFSSQLTDQENPTMTPAQIDTIMKQFMGINRYIRFPVLPYDGIHHIDMHMKLIDEQTLLVGKYPTGVSDGPQIEANLVYITSNFNSVYGTPYKVIRIPMPPDKYGDYPSAGGDYTTYTNAVFVNKTVILPTYYQQYDTTALRIWRESLPGYNVVGIDCDNSSANIISLSGAIHCITQSIGVSNPLLISHQPLENTCNTSLPYTVNASLQNVSGIASATIWWTTDTAIGFTNSVPMSLVSGNNWTGDIPPQANGTSVFYYVEGVAVNGKTAVRPIVAPAGWWKFTVDCSSASVSETRSFQFKNIYPNPASAITCIPVVSEKEQAITVVMKNILGQTLEILFSGKVSQGEKNVFLFADKYSAGTYLVEVKTQDGVYSQKVLIR
jgi:agmatine deiminase